MWRRYKRTAEGLEQSAIRGYASTPDEDGNTPLHKACAENDYAEAEALLRRLNQADADLLKTVLLAPNGAGKTPIDEAICAAGDSDSGDAALKLLLGAYIKDLDMMVELFAPGKTDVGIWKRQGFKLPQLGALLVADHEGKLVDLPECGAGRSGKVLLDKGGDYKEFVNEYAELPHEGIGLIVANAFMTEYAESAWWEQTRPWDEPGGTYGRPSQLGGVLNKCVMLTQDAQQAAEECERAYRSVEAAKFTELSERLQAATATALDSLGNDVAFAVACSLEGHQALNLAVQANQYVLLSSGALNGVFLRKWRGRRLHELLDRAHYRPYWFRTAFYFALDLLLNSLLLPLAAVAPSLAKHRTGGFARLFNLLRGEYLLQTAFFQASVFAACDFNLTLVLTAHFTTAVDTWPVLHDQYLLLLWAAAALAYELQQIFGRQYSGRGREGKVGLGRTFAAYLKADYFNALDLTALCACVLALCCSATLRLAGQHRHGGGTLTVDLATNLEDGLDLDDLRHDVEDVEASLAGLVGDLQRGGMMDLGAVTKANASLSAVALLLMWCRQIRLLTIVSSKMAPLVRMMRGMIADVSKFLQLLVLVLLGFASALKALFAADRTYAAAEADGGGDVDCALLIGPASTFASVLKILFEGSLLADSPFLECISHSEHRLIGLGLGYGFTLFSVVLLLNMLIAMMSKTFDRHSEAATQEAATQFAGIVQDWEGETNLPAPFNIASLPYQALRACRLFACCPGGGPPAASPAELPPYTGPKLKGTASFSKPPSGKPPTPVPGKTRGGASSRLLSPGMRSDEMPDADGPGASKAQSKGHRILLLGDQPGGKADLDDLKDQIADRLQSQFGDYEDTGTLIDNAVKLLQARMEALEARVIANTARVPGPA